jgi:hypothetical protein
MADVFGDDFEAKADAWIAREAANPTSQLVVIESAELARLPARVAELEGALRELIEQRDGHYSTDAAWERARQALGGGE